MATGDEVAQHAAGLVQQHIAWLERLENRMLSMEVGLATRTPTVDRLDNEFFNHDGGKGLKTLFLEHAAEQRQHLLYPVIGGGAGYCSTVVGATGACTCN